MKEGDLHMIRGIKEGREAAYAGLFDRYYKILSLFAFRYVEDLDTAKEIVQDLFVYLFEHRDSLVITTSLKSYLYHSVRNRCLNHLKHNKINQQHLDRQEPVASDENDPEAIFRETELEYRIYQVISNLPSRCRQIFRMSRMEGMKNSEIATAMNISVRTVETQISRALKTLREKLG